MELALFPIAAVLLLLSGVSAPAHALGQKAPTAALMRQFFRPGELARDQFATAGVILRNQKLARRGRRASPQIGLFFAGLVGHAAHPNPTGEINQIALQGLDRKHFRTRFGFADGAYQATAPPLA